MNTRFYLGETKDYAKFSFVESNREINQSNLNKIEKSILEIGIQVPIVVNDSYKVIEGQHRFVALRKNDMVVPYIVSTSAKESEIARLQESRKWTALDYCRSLASKGCPDCETALVFADEFYNRSNKKMTKILTLELMTNGKSHSCSSVLKKGNYRINTAVASDVFEAALVMSNYDMGTSPFGNKIIRSLKVLHYDFGGLNMDAIAEMTENNYIMAYSNEKDQFLYMKKKYSRYAKKAKVKSNKQ
jgi:hypothetical protein